MPNGKVKKLIRDRGFGFIEGEDGKEIFFHQTNLESGTLDAMSEGQAVEFDVEQSPKGPRAINVRPAQQ